MRAILLSFVVLIACFNNNDAIPLLVPFTPMSIPRQSFEYVTELAVWESLGLSDEDYAVDDRNLTLGAAPNYNTSVRFLLYTRKHSLIEKVVLADAASLRSSSMNPSAPTKIFLHGYFSTYASLTAQALKDAYLAKGDYNVVLVDWSDLSMVPSYLSARSHAVGVANRTAKFLDALADSNICPPKNQHVLGHSLGAQIVGMAGAAAKTRPGRITGLDPAWPLFEFAESDGRLDKTDADLVDVIHTAAGFYGMPGPMGHVDFYPNRGLWPQPGCLGGDLTGDCSHCRSVYLYAYTIGNASAFVGRRCQSRLVVKGQCPNTTLTASMGEAVTFTKPGIYYLNATLPDNELWQLC